MSETIPATGSTTVAPIAVRRLRIAAVLSLMALLLLPAVAPADTPAPDRARAADALAREFMAAFAAKDMERVGMLFAPNAKVQRARLEPEGIDLAQFDVTGWLAEAGPSIAPLRDFRIEVLETSSVAFDDGITVSVRFRATGAVGQDMSFVNDGVDTFSLVPTEDGELRIVLYNSMEKLTFRQGG